MTIDLRLRVLSLIIVPLAALVAASAIHIDAKQEVVSAVDASSADLPLAETVASLTESVAVERGLSANLLRGNTDIEADLTERRSTTDARRSALETLATEHGERTGEPLRTAIGALATVGDLRASVDGRAVQAGTAVAGYTELIDGLIVATADLAQDSGDLRLDQSLRTYGALLQLRDKLGVERAVVSSSLAPGASPNRIPIGVAVGETQGATDQFLSLTSADLTDRWVTITSGDLAAEIDRLRDQVIGGVSAEDIGLDATAVFGRYTELIAQVTELLEPQGAEVTLAIDEVGGDARSARNRAIALAVVPFIAAVAVAFAVGRSLVATLRQTTTDLIERAREVDALGSQLEASALDTVQRAQAVAATGEQISAAATAVSAAVSQLHTASQSISETASTTAVRAASAEQTAHRSAGEVASLDDASEQIASVAELISVIADQTNLLALNATIEAARAGSAGKGFSVVAGEVKALAQKTSDATVQIRDRIEQIRRTSEGSSAAFGAMNEDITTIADDQRTVAAAVEEQTITIRQTSGEVAVVADATTHIAEQVGDIVADAERSLDRANEASELASGLLRASRTLEKLIGG